MATKLITTRIKNKVDSLSAWEGYTGTLLDGEIAIVRVETGETYTNPITNADEPVVELLMKVGDGSTPFGSLPWLSAKASDVYGWAKAADPSTITVKYNKGSDASPSWQSSTLANILKDLETAEAAIASIKTGFSVSPASATANGVVQGITYDSSTGKFTVSYGTVVANDIASNAVTTAKIADGNVTTAKIADSNVTTAKIANAAVTNAKLGSDISSDKINLGTSTTSGTLTAKIQSMDALIAGKADSHNHPYAADNHNHDSVYIKPADVDSKISTALGSVLKYKGTKTTTANLPTSGNSTGDVWNITSKCAASGSLPAVNAGDNVAWNGTSWDVLAGTIDLSNYYTKAGVDAELAKKANSTITAGASDDDVVVLTGTNGTNGVSYSASHANSGVTAGTYRSVTVNAKGHVTAGTNPTTLSGYGITDAYTKSNVYTKAEVDAELAKKSDNHDHPYAPSSHTHGNITNSGTITSTAVTSATGVLVYDSSNKIQRATAANARAIIGAGTSNLALGTTSTTAAAGNHTHTAYAQAIANIESNYARIGTVGSGTSAKNYLYDGKDGTDILIFDCGGASDI